jgi:hypothetical protein
MRVHKHMGRWWVFNRGHWYIGPDLRVALWLAR